MVKELENRENYLVSRKSQQVVLHRLVFSSSWSSSWSSVDKNSQHYQISVEVDIHSVSLESNISEVIVVVAV